METQQSGDPFGGSVGERTWRRLAGAGLVVVLAAFGFVLWNVEVLPFVMVGALVVYLVGVPASWAVTRRGGAPIRRHVVAGIAGGVVAAVALSPLLVGDLLGVPFIAAFSVGLGVPVAAGAAAFGIGLPRRWVKPAAVAGLLVTFVALPAWTWLQQRPPEPHDYVIVHDLGGVRDHFESAHALAIDISERFEARAGAGSRRTAHATWLAIGQDLLDHELANTATWQRFTPDGDLPTLRSTGEPVRLVTTVFDDGTDRGCVIVTATASHVEPHACAELALAN